MSPAYEIANGVYSYSDAQSLRSKAWAREVSGHEVGRQDWNRNFCGVGEVMEDGGGDRDWETRWL